MFPHQINYNRDGSEVITAYNADSDTPFYTAPSNHPYFVRIKEGLENENPEVWSLFNIGSGATARMRQITERVSFDGQNILWDGDPVHTVLAEQIKRMIETGESNYEAVAKFWEKLASNPNEHSREQAYEFLATHSFQITSEGDVVGYKGVRRKDDTYYSTTYSRVPDVPSAYVDGEPVPPGQAVPNPIGSVVSMPRSEVKHDPAVACARGLHVATRAYAGSYSSNGAVLEVHVNPRDIVSVPNDASGRKVRVCRYYVARIAQDDTSSSQPVLSDSNYENNWSDVGYSE